MKFDLILVLLVVAVVGLAIMAPTVEGLEQNVPYTIRPEVPVSMAGTSPSPWLYSTTIGDTTESAKDRPRPYATDIDCKKIAGNLASVECADPDGNPLA
jgi:hypothetical protein